MDRVNYSDTHKEIVEQCKKGDKRAQFRLYQLYSKAMFNIALRILNSREEAEDLLQEAFSEAFNRLDSFRYESSFGAWLKRIVINRSINAIKKRKAELVYSDNIEEHEHFIDENTNDSELKMSVRRILDAVSELADGYRVIFSLYALEGYDHSEIAEVLNISESTSKSQYMRAKRKIKELLKN